jgi:glycosyltransferase involved in cell wall biosynthesis
LPIGCKIRDFSGDMGSDGPMKMLFIRDFQGASGGHLKYRNYLDHTKSISGVEPELYLTPTSLKEGSNPFLASGILTHSQLFESDSYFVAGMDWSLLDAAGIDLHGKRVVNLIQGLSHADPGDPKFAYLTRPALRICVSGPVAEALRATGHVVGPVVAIENGIDIGFASSIVRPRKRSGIFIAGYKSPELAKSIAAKLERSVSIDLAQVFVPQRDFLTRVAQARLCILLPYAKEGFYLPALEAMALGTPIIVPDCIGNRTFCIDGLTCLVPEYDALTIAQAAQHLLSCPILAENLANGARAMAERHSLGREREQYRTALLNFLRR